MQNTRLLPLFCPSCASNNGWDPVAGKAKAMTQKCHGANGISPQDRPNLVGQKKGI